MCGRLWLRIEDIQYTQSYRRESEALYQFAVEVYFVYFFYLVFYLKSEFALRQVTFYMKPVT